MIKINKKFIITLLFTSIPVISIFLGFVLNEDLSTGGSQWDFKLTWPVIVNYSNFKFIGAEEFTRHMPMHFSFLALLNTIFNDQNSVRLFYLFFSFLFPIFLYLNLSKIYNYKKINLIIFSSCFLFIPLLRANAIWANSHLTATIFFLIGNFFYLKSKENNIFIYQILNLLFLSFAIYSLQTYLILFLFYLYNYFLSEKFNNFIKLFLFSSLLALPGLYFIMLNPRISNITVSRDIFYTLSTNFSIIFFFLLFLLFNKKSFKIILGKIKNLNINEITIFIFLSFFIFYYQNLFVFESNLRGGGFFYKLSYFILNNNLIFLLSSILGLITVYVVTKHEPKLLYIIIIINFMALNYVVYQKYFEPLFLAIITILFKNFLINNIVQNLKNILVFYGLIFLYFLLAYINTLNKFSYNLLS